MVDYRNYANLGGQSGAGLLSGFLNARSAQGKQQLRQDDLDRQNKRDLIGGLKYGINTQRLNEPEYVQQVADDNATRRNSSVAPSLGSFGNLVQYTQTDEFAELPEDVRQNVLDRINSQSKGVNTLQQQAFATAQGKGRAELGYKPELAREVEFAKQSAQRDVERDKVSDEASRGVSDIELAGSNINRILDNNPALAGGYSPARITASRYNLPGGFSEEEQEQRGELTRNLSALQNKALALATQAGQSGINIQAEVDRITQGLQSTSTPAEIRGAIKAMQETQDRLSRQLGKSKDIITTQQPAQINNNDPLGLR